MAMGMLGTIAVMACSATGESPVVAIHEIFPPQDKHVHGSSIVECPNGDLLACWFHGSGERTKDDVLVQGSRLRKGSGEWEPVFVMADSPGFPDCNPVLYVDAKDRLWLFWIQVLAHRWEHSVLKYRRAEEYLSDGPPQWSWQDTIFLNHGERFAEIVKARFESLDIEEGMWAEYALPYSRMLIEAAQDPRKTQIGWMTRIHPLTLPSGRILLPLYSDGFNFGLAAISDDTGETWRPSEPIVGLAPIQPSFVRKQDGTIIAYCRDSGGSPGRILVATSSDEGETWTTAQDTDLPNPGSSVEAIRLADGRWLLVYNPSETSRTPLSVAVSEDEGGTWPVRWDIEPSDAAGKSFAYPSVIQARDGLVHLTYSYAGTGPGGREAKTIRHAVLDIR